MELSGLQQSQGVWQEYNFPNTTAELALLGITEEYGELIEALLVGTAVAKLSHAVLKSKQGVRGDKSTLVRDAVGDIVIYLAAFCNKYGISLDECVTDAWTEVFKRDWVKFPKNGVSE